MKKNNKQHKINIDQIKEWLTTIGFIIGTLLVVLMSFYFYKCSKDLKNEKKNLEVKIQNDSIANEINIKNLNHQVDSVRNLYLEEKRKKTRVKTKYRYMSKEEQIDEIESRMSEMESQIDEMESQLYDNDY